MPKSYSVEDCSSKEFKKIGDTIFLGGLQKLDTLSFYFGLDAGTGLDWKYNKSDTNNLKLFNEQVSRKTIAENVQIDTYQFQFIVIDTRTIKIAFILIRPNSSKVYKSCFVGN